MELNSRGYKASYLMQYLAEGEAPDEARNVFQQRSRWTKGHYQVSPVVAAGRGSERRPEAATVTATALSYSFRCISVPGR